MSVIRSTVTAAAKAIAQDPGGGAQLLLASGDYDLAIDQALQTFRADRPNLRIFHYTVVAAAFRYVLAGAGAILPTAADALDRWIIGGSTMRDVYYPYLTASQENIALDRNHWRIQREPSGIELLELLSITPSSLVLRLEFVNPHRVDAADIAKTSLLEGDVVPFETLVAAELCDAAARRYVQNTGTSTFQNETIDRRTQSDIMASRAKHLRGVYATMVGKQEGDVVAPAAVVKKFEIQPSHGRGRMFHIS